MHDPHCILSNQSYVMNSFSFLYTNSIDIFVFLFIYLFASVMARRCGGAEYPSSEHNFNIKEMLSEAGWCLVAHRSLREKMIRARDPLLRVSTLEEI